MNPVPDPTESLCAEVLAEGRRRAGEIRGEARRSGEEILARARSDAEERLALHLEEASLAAAALRERIMADIPIELARLRAARIEALLESLREEAIRKLLSRQGFDYPESLASLASEALGAMEGGAFTLGLAPEDMPLGEGLLRRLASPGRSLRLVEDPSIIGGGLILRDDEGRQLWDDRLPVRLARLWPELRIPVARILGLLGGP